VTEYSVGDRVVIRTNPHRAHAQQILGTVVGVRPREGFARSDLVDIEYEDPWTGESETMPFGTSHLSPGNPAALREMAERYEGLAAELRKIAGS